MSYFHYYRECRIKSCHFSGLKHYDYKIHQIDENCGKNCEKDRRKICGKNCKKYCGKNVEKFAELFLEKLWEKFVEQL